MTANRVKILILSRQTLLSRQKISLRLFYFLFTDLSVADFSAVLSP